MSLSRSPSPQPGGGWSTPGLTTVQGSTMARRPSPLPSANGEVNPVTWASASARSAEVRGYQAFSSSGQSWFGRHARKVSTNLANLPMFRQTSWAEKEKLGRGRYPMQLENTARILGRFLWRMRLRIAVILIIILAPILFYATRKFSSIRHYPTKN